MIDDPRLAKLLKAIIAYKRANDGNTPTYRELVLVVGGSINMIHRDVRALIATGAVSRCPGGLRVTGGTWTYV